MNKRENEEEIKLDEDFSENTENIENKDKVTQKSSDTDFDDGEEGDDIIDTDEDGNELSGKDIVKKLREKIKKLESEKQEYLNSWQRTLADYKNREKKIEEERKSWADFAVKRFTEDLLIVLDTYDAARSNKEAWETVDSNWRSGIEYIFQTFENKIVEKGFEKLSVKEGDDFDANIHEALGTVETEDESKDGKVAQIIMSGYNFKGTLFRPAKVKVYKRK